MEVQKTIECELKGRKYFLLLLNFLDVRVRIPYHDGFISNVLAQIHWKRLWDADKLGLHGTAEKYRNHSASKERVGSWQDTEWVPHCEKVFNGAQPVIDYLGKYPHRIAISNHRIICMGDRNVTFSVKDYQS